MVRWTEKEDQYLRDNYLILGPSKIAEILGRSRSATQQRASNTLGIKVSGSLRGVSEEELVANYEQLQSTRKVAKIYGVHCTTIGDYLKQIGKLNKPVRYSCDDNYFSQDTAEVFYWAGFIAADGCVKLENYKYKRLSIGLSQKDRAHLEKFKAAVNFTGPIYQGSFDNGKYFKSEVNIASDKMFDDLARFNIVPRKSLIYTFPEWLIEHQLVNHFMRGYNDGDGSFYKSGKNKKTSSVQLYTALRGTREFLTAFKLILERECDTRKSEKKPRLSCGIYTLEYAGNAVVPRIRDFLYKDSNDSIRLTRKYDIAFDEQFTQGPDHFTTKKAVVGTNMDTGEEIYFDSIRATLKAGFNNVMVGLCCREIKFSHRNYTWEYAKPLDQRS